MRSSPSRWAWWATFALVAIYAGYYARQLWLSDAVPTFDQAAYIAKTWAIADVLWHPMTHLGALFNPATYLGEPAANRPPLMMVIAAVFTGPTAEPRAIATVWLVVRLAVLLLAVRRLEKLVGDVAGGWWVPASVATILAAPTNHILYPNLYMMDTPFEAFGLLAVVCLAADVYKRTRRTATAAALTTVALFLVKPAAVVFVAPLYVWILCQSRRPDWRRLRPYLVMVVVMGLLIVSPYGRAVVDQYRLGMTGYWASPTSLQAMLMLFGLVVPAWAAIVGGYGAFRGSVTRPPTTTYLAAALLVGVWWYVFNVVITYTHDPRILPAAMPAVVSAAMIAACARPVLKQVSVGVAVVLFGVSITSALGGLTRAAALPFKTLTAIAGPQPPVREVGLNDFAVRLCDQVTAGRVMMLCHDDFVENNALHLAVRRYGSGKLVIDSFPWGATGLDLRQRFADPEIGFEYFITKARRKTATLEGDVWTNQQALESLVVADDSPWRDKFQRLFSSPIVQPDMADVVTVWRQVGRLTEADLAAGYAYILPRYAGTAGEAEVRRRAGVVKP